MLIFYGFQPVLKENLFCLFLGVSDWEIMSALMGIELVISMELMIICGFEGSNPSSFLKKFCFGDALIFFNTHLKERFFYIPQI